MEAIFQSFLLVLFSEFGDKTQLIALLLVTKFKKAVDDYAWDFIGHLA